MSPHWEKKLGGYVHNDASVGASPSNRYVNVLKDSATDGQTFAGYGQILWTFRPGWELELTYAR